MHSTDSPGNTRKWWILVAMATALSLVFIDQTAVSVALPQIQRDLNSSSHLLHWIINAYLLSLAAVVIFGGKIGDLLGHRHAFFAGTIVFILASLSCAGAESGLWIVISRAIQGVGGAFMIPATGVIVINAFTEKERGRAMGIYIGLASISLSLGPLLGGVLTQFLSWRWVFGINFPLALVSIILTFKSVLKEERKEKISIDWFGFILLVIFIFCLILDLMEVSTLGWASPVIWVLFSTSILSGTAFIFLEQRLKNPLLELSIFKNRIFSMTVIVLIILQSTFISFVFWMIFIQDVLLFPPSMAGLLMLPVTIPLIFMGPFSGYLRDRIGPRFPISLGALLVVSSMIWIAATSWTYHYIWMFPGFLLLGFATPLVVSNSMATGISVVLPHQRGVGSGVLRASRQLGSSVGLAIIGSLITHLNKMKLSYLLSHVLGPVAQIRESQIDGILAGTTSSKQAIAHLSSQEVNTIHQIAIHAYTFAFSTTMYILAGIAFVGFLFALQIPKYKFS